MTSRPYTSVWNDLNQVEFSQGFLQAGPYRTRYLHAGDTDKPVLLFLSFLVVMALRLSYRLPYLMLLCRHW